MWIVDKLVNLQKFSTRVTRAIKNRVPEVRPGTRANPSYFTGILSKIIYSFLGICVLNLFVFLKQQYLFNFYINPETCHLCQN